MIKRDQNKIHKMEELADNGAPLKDIEGLSAADLRSMIYVLIERIKRIEQAIEERAIDAKQRFEGFPKDYVGATLYNKDILALQDAVKALSNWKENTVGSATTKAAGINLIVAIFGGSIGAAITFILSGGLK